MKTKKDYLKLLNEVKWENKDKIEKFLIPAFDIKLNENTESFETGLSKFGGTPDLPKEIDWPTFEGEPMAFLSQINLEQLSDYDIESVLPKSGILYFFSTDLSDYPPKHKVLFSKSSEVHKVEFPISLNDDFKFNELVMSFEKIYTFPSGETLEFESLSENDQDVYHELDEDIFTYENNQILGHTYPAQGDVNLEWACERLEIDLSEVYDSDQEIVNKKRIEFINLFQFSTENSIPELYDNFYVSGMGYFGIEKNDLKNCDFDKTILIIQN